MALRAWVTWIALCGALAIGGGAGCDIPQGKVASGQLYTSGEARFDQYFRDVHAIQVWAAQWPDDRKATRRPLLTVLDLTADAPDVTIVQAAHEKVEPLTKDGGGTKLEAAVDEAHVVATGTAKVDTGLFHGIEETAAAELQRAKKLDQMLPKIDELTKVGQSLEPHVQTTFQRSPGKAKEVKSELEASLNALLATTTNARRAIRECDDFVADLQRAVAAGTEGGRRIEAKSDAGDKKPKPAKKTDARPAAPKPPPPVAKKEDTTKPPKADTPTPPSAPAKPAPKNDGEVFNP